MKNRPPNPTTCRWWSSHLTETCLYAMFQSAFIISAGITTQYVQLLHSTLLAMMFKRLIVCQPCQVAEIHDDSGSPIPLEASPYWYTVGLLSRMDAHLPAPCIPKSASLANISFDFSTMSSCPPARPPTHGRSLLYKFFYQTSQFLIT